MPQPNVVSLTKDVYVATYENVVLVHFRRETPLSCAEPVRAAMAQLAKRPGKFLFFAVIEIESAAPDDAARKLFAKTFEDHAEHIAAIVIAHRGEGFRGAMVRTIVSGIVNLLPRKRFPFPRHVVGTVEEAASLALKALPGLDTAGLLSAFRALSEMSPPKS